jgi:hypothetical protein
LEERAYYEIGRLQLRRDCSVLPAPLKMQPFRGKKHPAVLKPQNQGINRSEGPVHIGATTATPGYKQFIYKYFIVHCFIAHCSSKDEF